MDARTWLAARGGLAHRDDLLAAGFSAYALRSACSAGAIMRVRRYWLRTADAAPELVVAAAHTARLACLSAARHRGWWMPHDVDGGIHLHVHPNAEAPAGAGITAHWSRPIVPVGPRVLIESVHDTLDHVAQCATAEQARIIWESAIRARAVSRAELLRVRWTTLAGRTCAGAVGAQSDSGLETIFVARIAPWGLALRQQVRIAGHPVDVLVGERLVVQLDGFAYHSTPADRARDLAHDRELAALGYTVLRFTYAEVVHDWAVVERAIARAVAQGAHLAR